MSEKCSSCGAELVDGSRYCAQCGREVPPPSEREKAERLLEIGAISQEEYDRVLRIEGDKELEQSLRPPMPVVSPSQPRTSVGRGGGGCCSTVVIVFVLIPLFVCGVLSLISNLDL